MSDNWKTEIIKKIPWSATFLLAAFGFFKYTNHVLVAWICFIVAIITLFLVIRFEYYERIIDRQEKQIKYYSKQAMDSHSTAAKTVSELTSSVATAFDKNYKKESEEQTETS